MAPPLMEEVSGGVLAVCTSQCVNVPMQQKPGRHCIEHGHGLMKTWKCPNMECASWKQNCGCSLEMRQYQLVFFGIAWRVLDPIIRERVPSTL